MVYTNNRVRIVLGVAFLLCVVVGFAIGQSRNASTKADLSRPEAPQGVSVSIVDGGFETSSGNPITNPNWTAASTTFGTPICSVAVCGSAAGAVAPRNGTFFTWLGGAGVAETGSVQQSLTIPSGGRPVLKYWLKIATVNAPFNAVMTVKIDGNVIQTITEPAVAQGGYSLVSVAIPPVYGDNGVHTIRFEYINPAGSGISNFLVDDISLDQNAIADNGFEASVAGNPITNPNWTGTSTNFTNPFCSPTLCGNGGGASPPRNGTFWVWFGGTTSGEFASIQQSVVIPQNSRPVLKFWFRNGSVSTPFGSNLKVMVNGVTIKRIDEKTVADTAYSQVSVALPASVANGAAHTIRLEYVKAATTAISSMVVDDITLDTSAATIDYDGDRKTDVSIFRPAPGEWWVLRSTNASNFALQFGSSTDRLVPADYTGDGKADVAFWRPSNGNWFILRSEDSTFFAFPFGTNGDKPVPGDYDGDGKADAAVFRESSLTWFISKSSGGTDIVSFGATGDKPVIADYDGDAKADIAIFRPVGASGSEWWVRRSSNGSSFALQFGTPTDRPVQGDFTGDGKADVAFWRPSNGNWFVLRSEDFSFFAFPFGANGDVPVPGDYDGDGKFDAGVFRPSNLNWFVQRSTAGTLIQAFGAAGDIPTPSVYVP